MNRYRNTVTGVVITTPCVCAGENWEPVKGKKKAAPQEKEQEETAEKEQEIAEEPQETQQGGTVIGPAPEKQEAGNE